MSGPIDFIDLTVDSPNKIPTGVSASSKNKNRNRNIENIPNNGTTTTRTTKSQRRNTWKQQSSHHDSVIEVPTENVQSSEIIDLDVVSSPANTKTYSTNDSVEGNAVTLMCPICLEPLSSKLKPMSTRCGHIFCSYCLELATRMSKKCPTCKKAVKFQNCTRLYF